MNERIEDNEFEEGPFNIRYDKVMKQKDFLPITRTLQWTFRHQDICEQVIF